MTGSGCGGGAVSWKGGGRFFLTLSLHKAWRTAKMMRCLFRRSSEAQSGAGPPQPQARDATHARRTQCKFCAAGQAGADLCRGGGIGRHAILRGWWAKACKSSSLFLGTTRAAPGGAGRPHPLGQGGAAFPQARENQESPCFSLRVSRRMGHANPVRSGSLN